MAWPFVGLRRLKAEHSVVGVRSVVDSVPGIPVHLLWIARFALVAADSGISCGHSALAFFRSSLVLPVPESFLIPGKNTFY